MKAETYKLEFEAERDCGIVEITDDVQQEIARSGVRTGTATLFVVGSTGALTTVEYEPGLVKDLKAFYDKIIPPTRDYYHEQTWHDGNGFSHVRASLLKPDLVVPIVEGRLRLGTWQQVILINFDNKRRSREVRLQVIGSE